MEQKWESTGHATIVPERLPLSKDCLASSSRFQRFFKLSQKSTLLLQFPHFLLVFLFFFHSLNISLQLFFFFFYSFHPIWSPKQLNRALFSFHFQSHLGAQNNSFSGWSEEKKRLLLFEGVYTFVYHFLIFFFYFLIN